MLIDDSADLILNRCDDQIVKGETKHLIVVLSVPIAYPRLVLLHSFLNKIIILHLDRSMLTTSIARRGLRMFSRVERVIL